MAELKLDARPRTLIGRKVRQLRTQGLVPVVVYGKTQEPINLQVTVRGLDRALQHGGLSQLVEVNVEGGATHNILVREVQRDPVTKHYLHADFYAVNMLEMQEVSISVVSVNRPENVVAGLMIFQALDSVEIRALPADIPASIEVNISRLDLEHPITIADLPSIPGVEYLNDPEEHVFTMITTRVVEEEEEEVEEVSVEPEVVGKGKQEEEEEE